MAYTKYSLTPANNNATPPDGAPEGMLPSAVNDTMRDMMAQIRDVGDGIRNGTYTMTAPVITGGSITGVALSGNTFTNPVITGGSINNTPIGASTANTGAFTTLSASGATTFSGATVVSGSLTANTFSSSGATITGGSINSTAIGGSTAAAGAFTTLSASGAFAANGGATLGDASGDALTINSSAVSIPNGLNFDSNTFVIDATNNNVGIGTSSPTQKLDVRSAVAISDGTVNFVAGAGAFVGGQFGLGTTSNNLLAFATNNAERMRITSGGQVLINTTSGTMGGTGKSPFLRIATSTSVALGLEVAGTGDSNQIVFNNGNGEVGAINTSGTSTSYNTSSDYRLKENIALMQNALGVVQQLKPVTYKWKVDGSAGQGFIAHELQAVVPDAVTGEKDAVDEKGNPKYQGVDTSFLVATLTAAIQEQQAMIEELKQEVAALKAK